MKKRKRSVWQCLKWLTIEVLYAPAILLLGVCPREMKMCSYKDLYANVHSSIIHNTSKLETTQMLINGWIHKHGISVQWNTIWP